MPIYEYQCNGCHHQFDLIQKIGDAPITTCPQCSEEKVVRLVSAAGFQLKGSGWYATDFKTKSKENKAEATPSEKNTESASATEKKPTEASTGSKSE